MQCFAQESESHSITFRVNGGFLINRAFSNITQKTEVVDDYSVITRSPSDSSKIKAGFFLGGEALAGKGDKFKGAFALSVARSAAEYHYSFLEQSPTSRPGFTHLTRETELEHTESYFYLDVQAGVRNRIAENFYLTSALVLNQPIIARRSSYGYALTTFSSSTSAEVAESIEFVQEEKKSVKGDANLSFRLRGEYQFSIGDNKASVLLFRNFGLMYSLPWWGLGFSFTVN